MQDKSASRSERLAFGQPEQLPAGDRSLPLSTHAPRSQKQHAHRSGLVPLTTMWNAWFVMKSNGGRKIGEGENR